jgi:hypothetical protein
MIRNFKALGLALVAVFAMSAVVASAASATAGTLTAGGKTAIATAEQTTGHKFTLTDHKIGEGFATTECTTAVFTGTEGVTDGATSVRAHPIYEGCKAFGLNATITTTGCDYVLNTGTPAEGGGWHVVTDVVCASTAGTPHVIKIVTATCEVQVGSQTGLATSSVTNSGGGTDLLLNTNISGITYNVTKDGIGCPLSGTGVKSQGDYTGTTTVQAHDSTTKAAVGIQLH